MMELWYNLLLLVVLVSDWTTASVYKETQLPADELVADSCGLTEKLLHSNELYRESEQQVIKKDATIRQLKFEISNAANMLKDVGDTAESEKQQHKILRKKYDDLQHQVQESDTVAYQQIEKILYLTNSMYNKSPTNNLQQELTRLENELIASQSTNKQLAQQLANKTQQMEAMGNEQAGNNLNSEAMNKISEDLKQCQAERKAVIFVEKYREDRGLANSRLVIMESACLGNDVLVLGAMLDLDFNCETPIDVNGNGCLNLAAYRNNVDAIRMLLSRKCDINYKIQKAGAFTGLTPLMMAAHHGRLSAAEELLKNKPDLSARAISGLTALGMARKQGKTELAQLLVTAGVPI